MKRKINLLEHDVEKISHKTVKKTNLRKQEIKRELETKRQKEPRKQKKRNYQLNDSNIPHR